nr:ORF20 [Bracoviriform inaniti]
MMPNPQFSTIKWDKMNLRIFGIALNNNLRIYGDSIDMSGAVLIFLVHEIKKVVLEIEELEQQLLQIKILKNMNILKKRKHSLQTSLRILCNNTNFPESEIYWTMYL